MTAAALWLAAAPAALAASEQGDAGDLPASAQDPQRRGGADARRQPGRRPRSDLYRARLTGGGSFSATTVGGTSVDTQLFFDGQGRRVRQRRPRWARVNYPARGRAVTPAAAPIPAGDLALQPRSMSLLGPDLFRSAVGRGRHRRAPGPGAQQLERHWSTRRLHDRPDRHHRLQRGRHHASGDRPARASRRRDRRPRSVRPGRLLVQRRRRIRARLCIGTVADGEPPDTGTVGVRRSPCAPATTPATSRR